MQADKVVSNQAACILMPSPAKMRTPATREARAGKELPENSCIEPLNPKSEFPK
jgi:hypothetical protein